MSLDEQKILILMDSLEYFFLVQLVPLVFSPRNFHLCIHALGQITATLPRLEKIQFCSHCYLGVLGGKVKPIPNSVPLCFTSGGIMHFYGLGK